MMETSLVAFLAVSAQAVPPRFVSRTRDDVEVIAADLWQRAVACTGRDPDRDGFIQLGSGIYAASSSYNRRDMAPPGKRRFIRLHVEEFSPGYSHRLLAHEIGHAWHNPYHPDALLEGVAEAVARCVLPDYVEPAMASRADRKLASWHGGVSNYHAAGVYVHCVTSVLGGWDWVLEAESFQEVDALLAEAGYEGPLIGMHEVDVTTLRRWMGDPDGDGWTLLEEQVGVGRPLFSAASTEPGQQQLEAVEASTSGDDPAGETIFKVDAVDATHPAPARLEGTATRLWMRATERMAGAPSWWSDQPVRLNWAPETEQSVVSVPTREDDHWVLTSWPGGRTWRSTSRTTTAYIHLRRLEDLPGLVAHLFFQCADPTLCEGLTGLLLRDLQPDAPEADVRPPLQVPEVPLPLARPSDAPESVELARRVIEVGVGAGCSTLGELSTATTWQDVAEVWGTRGADAEVALLDFLDVLHSDAETQVQLLTSGQLARRLEVACAQAPASSSPSPAGADPQR